MTKLSISRAWNEATALIAQESALLIPVALAFIALPSAVLEAVQPIVPPGQPAPPGPWLLAVPPWIFFTLLGYLAIVLLLTRPGLSVGEAVRAALGRWLPAFGAIVLLAIAAAIMLAPLVVASAGAAAAAAMAGTPPQLNLGLSLLALASMLILLALVTRLALVYVVAANERLGPIEIVRRSWALSRGQFWRLFGFFILMVIVFVIVLLAIEATAGIALTLAFGPPAESGTAKVLLALINGVAGAFVALYVMATLARIYAQLTPQEPTPVSLNKGI